MFRTVVFVFCVQVNEVGWSITGYLLDWGLGCEGQRAENLSVRRWMKTRMGWMFRENDLLC